MGAQKRNSKTHRGFNEGGGLPQDPFQSYRSLHSHTKSDAVIIDNEPPQIYLRNYETTKDRCERIYKENNANLLAKTVYNSKRKINNNGNFLRPKVTSKEKHLPLKLAEVSEQSRLKDAIEERGGVSLRESFDARLY